MTDATQKATELLDKLTILTEKYAPQVYQTAVDVVQTQAVGEICLSFFCLLALSFFWQKMAKLNKDKFFDDKDEVICVVSFIFCFFATFIIALDSLISLLDAWNWVALFLPDLALAHKILNI